MWSPALRKHSSADGDRRHAGGGGARGLGAFQQAHALLEHGDGRVGEARVDEAGVLVLEAGLGLLGAVVDEGLGEEQRLRRLAELRAQRAAVHEQRLGAPVADGRPGWQTWGTCRSCARSSPAQAAGNKKPANPATALYMPRRCWSVPGRSTARGLLASCFAWLQAGRPNHHVVDTGITAFPGLASMGDCSRRRHCSEVRMAKAQQKVSAQEIAGDRRPASCRCRRSAA